MNIENPLKTINDFLESFSEYEIDWVENKVDEFAHEFPMEDFSEYIIINDEIKLEKEYVLIQKDDNEKEIWIYTNKNDLINGYSFNND